MRLHNMPHSHTNHPCGWCLAVALSGNNRWRGLRHTAETSNSLSAIRH